MALTTLVPGFLSPRVEPTGATTPSTALQVKSGYLTFDKTWSPHVQGEFTCVQPATAAGSAAIDPRTGLAFRATATIATNGVVKSLPMALQARSKRETARAAEVAIDVASSEASLQDFMLNAAVNFGSDQAFFDTNLVDQAVQQANSFGANLTWSTVDGSAAITVAGANATWPLGTTAWDYITGMEEAGGLWFRGDETGALLRSSASWAANSATTRVLNASNILDVVDVVDRDDPAWANFAVVQYSDGQVDSSPDRIGSGPLKTLYVTRKGKRGIGGAGTVLGRRAAKRGRRLSVTALADLDTRPNQPVSVAYQGRAFTGVIEAVTFRWPECTEDLTVVVNET